MNAKVVNATRKTFSKALSTTVAGRGNNTNNSNNNDFVAVAAAATASAAAAMMASTTIPTEEKNSDNSSNDHDETAKRQLYQHHGLAATTTQFPWHMRTMMTSPWMKTAQCDVAAVTATGATPLSSSLSNGDSSSGNNRSVWSSQRPKQQQKQRQPSKQKHLGLKRRRTLERMKNTSERVTLDSKYEVEKDNPLGQGAFGTVYRAVNRRTGEFVAVKEISKRHTTDVSFQNEMDALMNVRQHGGHPNICGLRENFDEGSRYLLVLDLVSGGEMFDHLCSRGPYSEADAARLVKEVASALAFLHGTGVVHGDLKPENLLLSSNNPHSAVIKVVDFGCAQVVVDDNDLQDKKNLSNINNSNDSFPWREADYNNNNPNMTKFRRAHTPAYCPPEGLEDTNSQPTSNSSNKDDKQPLDPSFDMWALGVILYIMLTGYHPFDLEGDASDDETIRKVLNHESPPLDSESPITEHLSPSAINLIRNLMAWDSNSRLSALEMLDHPWVRGETAINDKRLSMLPMYRKYKTKLQAKVFADMVDWTSSSQDNNTSSSSDHHRHRHSSSPEATSTSSPLSFSSLLSSSSSTRQQQRWRTQDDNQKRHHHHHRHNNNNNDEDDNCNVTAVSRASLLERAFHEIDSSKRGYITTDDLIGLSNSSSRNSSNNQNDDEHSDNVDANGTKTKYPSKEEPSSAAVTPSSAVTMAAAAAAFANDDGGDHNNDDFVVALDSDGDDEDDDALSLSGFTELLADSMKDRFFPKGHIVYREGEKGDHMYFINSGTVEATSSDGHTSLRSQGNTFGQGALLQKRGSNNSNTTANYPQRFSTIRCVTPVHVIEVNRDVFERFLKEDNKAIMHLTEKDNKRKQERAMRKLRLQKNLTDHVINRGEYIYQEGDDGDNLFMLESGIVEVSMSNIKNDGGDNDDEQKEFKVFELSPGDICGDDSDHDDDHSTNIKRSASGSIVAAAASLLSRSSSGNNNNTEQSGNRRTRNTSARCVTNTCHFRMMGKEEYNKLVESSPPWIQKSLRDISLRRSFRKAMVSKIGKSFPTNDDELREAFQVAMSSSTGIEAVDDAIFDNNMSLGFEEIQNLITAFDPSYSKEDIKAVLKALDLDHKGFVTFHEFVRIFREY